MAAFISEANLITYIETVINFQTSIDNFRGLSYDSLGDVDDLMLSTYKTGLLVTVFIIVVKKYSKESLDSIRRPPLFLYYKVCCYNDNIFSLDSGLPRCSKKELMDLYGPSLDFILIPFLTVTGEP